MNANELEIDEADLGLLDKVNQGAEAVVFENSKGVDVDDEEIARAISSLPELESFTSLVVGVSSRLRDLSIVRKFPRLVNIQVNGARIRSLDGLREFRSGRYLNVDTGANRSRDIAGIADTAIAKLSLHYARPEDFAAIAASSTITHLELGSSPRPPLESWTRVPISILSLSGGTFSELGNTAVIGSLTRLVLVACRRLEALVGDNHHVKWLVIQGSGRLRLDSIATFVGLESLYVVGSGNKLALSALAELKSLATASFESCKIEIDRDDIASMLPRLAKLHATGLRKDVAVRLSSANPGILLSTERGNYRGGVVVNDD